MNKQSKNINKSTDRWSELEYQLDCLGCIETTTPSKAEFAPYQDVLNQARQMLKTSKPSAGMAGKIAELEGFAMRIK